VGTFTVGVVVAGVVADGMVIVGVVADGVVTVGGEGLDGSGIGTVTPTDPAPVSTFASTEPPFASTETDGDDEPDPVEPGVEGADPGGTAVVGAGDAGGGDVPGPGVAGPGSLPAPVLVPSVLPPGRPTPVTTGGTTTPTDAP
jgi:hypothetical protein